MARVIQPTSGFLEQHYFESLWEKSWIQWCLLLQREGFIKSFGRSETYLLTSNVIIPYKVGKKSKAQVIMRGCEYTPDYIVTWADNWRSFVWDIESETKKDRELVGRFNSEGNMVTVIEIKPVMDSHNSIRIATDRIKFLFSKNGVWVNLLQPDLFYEAVFPPPEWLLTPTGKPKKMKYVPKTLNEYLKTL